MKTRVFLFIFFYHFFSAFCQQKETDSICGVVCSIHSNRPQEEAVIKNGNKAHAISDDKGAFCIKAKTGDVLTISKMGFRTQKVKIEDYNTLYVFLSEKSEELQEVVVSGNKNINDIDIRKLTGAITTIDMKKIANRPEMDIMHLLQGHIPGLMVISNGELGTKPIMRIRGESSFTTSANEPLFVLDGMVITTEALLALNPEDFEEVKVLKDAAASALYGIKAANGVIEITSKKGFVGKPYVTFNAKTGITFKGPRGVKMMKSDEKLELERLIKNESTPGYRYSADYYRKYYSGASNLDALIAEGEAVLDSLRAINTDWFKELIRMNMFRNYSLGIRGGTEKNTYFYSLSYGKQGGRIKGNDIQRLTARMNQDYMISPSFNILLNLGGGYSTTNTPNGSEKDPTTLVYELNPYEQKNDPQTGEPATLYSYPERTYYDLVNEYKSKTTSKRIDFSTVFHWNLLKNLDISGIAGGDYLLSEAKRIIPSTAYSQINYPDKSKGELKQDKATEFNATANLRVNYSCQIGHHDITLGANTDYYFTSYDGIGLKGYGLPSKINTAAGINQGLTDSRRVTINNRKEKMAQLGYGLVAGYSYKEIYDLYSSFKRDASSLLPSNKRWNTAWSIGTGWRLGNYSFFRNKILTDLHLKASYGYTAGMAGIAVASAIPTFSYQETTYASGRVFTLEMLYNKELKPQKIKNTNIGIELTFCNRIRFETDFYKNRTKDALLTVPIPPSNGYSVMLRNVGVLDNYGMEIRLSGDMIRRGAFIWNTVFSLSRNKNKVVKLYDGDKLYLSNESLIPDLEVGMPIGIIYGLHSLGIHPVDGLPRYLSADGEEFDHTHGLERSDFVRLGYSTPPYMGFFNHAITYKSISLTFDLYFTFGGKQAFSRSYVRDSDNIRFNAVAGQTKDMWFEPGDENKIYHTPNVPGSAYHTLSFPNTKTVFHTDYVRLNNVTLNYRVPAHLMQKINWLQYLQVNIQAQNLLTIRRETDKASLVNVVQPVLTMGINATF